MLTLVKFFLLMCKLSIFSVLNVVILILLIFLNGVEMRHSIKWDLVCCKNWLNWKYKMASIIEVCNGRCNYCKIEDKLTDGVPGENWERGFKKLWKELKEKIR